MDPHLGFWTFAFLLMAVAVGCAAAGWMRIRRGEVDRHRRLMNLSGALVLLFLLCYLGKVILLGGEELADWSSRDRAVLRLHETFVAVMLLSGTAARWIGRQLPDDGAAEPLLSATRRARHRLAGRLALLSAFLGLLSALAVLGGMVRRAAPAGLGSEAVVASSTSAQ